MCVRSVRLRPPPFLSSFFFLLSFSFLFLLPLVLRFFRLSFFFLSSFLSSFLVSVSFFFSTCLGSFLASYIFCVVLLCCSFLCVCARRCCCVASHPLCFLATGTLHFFFRSRLADGHLPVSMFRKAEYLASKTGTLYYRRIFVRICAAHRLVDPCPLL